MNNELFMEITKDLTNLYSGIDNDVYRQLILQRNRTLTSVLDDQIVSGYIYRMNNGKLLDLLKVAVSVDNILYGYHYEYDTDESDKHGIIPVLTLDISNIKFVDEIIQNNTNVESSTSFKDFTVIQFSTCFYPIIISYGESISDTFKNISDELDIDVRSGELILFIETLTSELFNEVKKLYRENDITIISLNNKSDIDYDVKATLLGYDFEIKER